MALLLVDCAGRSAKKKPMTPPRAPSALRQFLRGEASAGLVLIAAAFVALIAANTPLSGLYFHLVRLPLGIWRVQNMPGVLEDWVNDGLMAIFFLLIGLEIKRELYDGQLSTWPRRALPGLAALGGMVAPAILYLAINLIPGGAPRGWGVPTATDIAFALGVLSLLGPRVPVSLKVFLTALAILDDLGAIVIIAIFYNHGFDWMAMLGAGLVLFMMLVIGRLHVVRVWPYALLAVVLWWFFYRAHVNATMAGVAAAMLIPVRRTPAQPQSERSPLHRMENGLQKWVAYGVLPLFAFVNAGVPLAAIGWRELVAPAPLGVLVALIVGKQAGVFAACWLAAKYGLAERPAGATWRQVHGVALLCGVGFTMSLFIALLAFPDDPGMTEGVKAAILLASVLSAGGGALALWQASKKR